MVLEGSTRSAAALEGGTAPTEDSEELHCPAVVVVVVVAVAAVVVLDVTVVGMAGRTGCIVTVAATATASRLWACTPAGPGAAAFRRVSRSLFSVSL